MTPSVQIFPIIQTMTTPVSQTTSADNTKNTKDNHKIVVASYFRPYSCFKIPDNLDLEDTTIVEGWGVKWNELHITYTTRENYILYVGKEPVKSEKYGRGDEDDLTQVIKVDMESEVDYKYPEDQEIVDAEDYCIEYEEDDADEQKVEEKVKEKVEEKEKEKVEETEEEEEEEEDDDEDNGLLVFKVLHITFARDNDYGEPDRSMPELVKDRLWEARDEEHLWDVISDETGWLCEGVCERVI